MSNQLKKIILPGIIFLALIARIYWAFFTQLPTKPFDTLSYFEQADAILKGGYINFFPNGYPFIIAITKLLIGNKVVSGLLWLNIAMSMSIIYFSYKIAKKIYAAENIAFIVACAIALFPSQLNSVRWLMSEIPVSFFLIGSYFFYYHKKILPAGLFIGLATIIRTEMMAILLMLLIIDIIHYKKINLLFIAGSFIPLLIVAAFCYSKTGQFSLSGHNAYNIIIASRSSGDDIDFSYPSKHPEIVTNKYATKMYLDFIKNEPWNFIKSRLNNLWNLWALYQPPTKDSPGIVSTIIRGVGNLLILTLGLSAWWQNRKNYTIGILIIPFLVITIVHVIYFGQHRNIVPVEPFLIILSAWKINALFANTKKTLR